MELASLAPAPGLVRQTAERLLACNQTSARFGLALSPAEARELALARFDTLRDTGRMEFGEGILPRLAFTFCDSPYLAPHNYADALHEQLACFYQFKNQSMERISDDDLLRAMKTAFDGVCQGSLEHLRGTALEELCQAAREEAFGLFSRESLVASCGGRQRAEPFGWFAAIRLYSPLERHKSRRER